jgi:hypothetical protein
MKLRNVREIYKMEGWEFITNGYYSIYMTLLQFSVIVKALNYKSEGRGLETR